MDYYSDNDRQACAWLRELIKDGQIPEGAVDERDIKEIKGSDLAGYRRVHLFAGIGGWAYALELAGWPADRPIWTGSCPCQPFSAAGKRKGQEDERHLWPVFLRLIRECRPPTIFGEQVASDDGYRWLARVRDDLEEAGYAVGCADLPACCQGAPHIRQRLFWVAKSQYSKRPRDHRAVDGEAGRGQNNAQDAIGCSGTTGGLADSTSVRCERLPAIGESNETPQGNRRMRQSSGVCTDGGVGQSTLIGDGTGADGGSDCQGQDEGRQRGVGGSGASGFWANSELIPCRDGKARRVEPEIFPLADGVPGRVGLLRGAGNAIVPQVAAAFVRAFLETEE